MKKGVLIVLWIIVAIATKANVKPNTLFTSNGVLQQNIAVPVWGTASEGEKITVSFNGQTISTVATNGKWLVVLQPMKASATALSMIIKGNNTVTVDNILIGEVWLCSGQSNMGFPLRAVRAIGNYPSVETVLKDAQNYPMIRQFAIPLIKSTKTPAKRDDVNGKWSICDSITAKNFSAVAYFFGRELYKKIQVPIGLVNSSYGGTAIENWVSKETLDAFPELVSIASNYEKALQEFPQKMEAYQQSEASLLAKYTADSAMAVQAKKELPRKPAAPMSPAERGGPTGLWNTMISPLIPYPIKGCVWYQGEANGGRGLQYRTLLPALINSWRKSWGLGDFPFLIVQIPGWKGHQPELREAQLLTWQKLPNTAMTVINDCDDTLDVHPGNKQPVGERLALAARAIAYGDNIEYSGPVYKTMKIDGNKAILTFTHIGKGLMAKNGELQNFVIAAADKKFVAAKAEIMGNTVIVSAEGINNPVAVRLGWRFSPQVNLYNKDGLPATPFRTDVP